MATQPVKYSVPLPPKGLPVEKPYTQRVKEAKLSRLPANGICPYCRQDIGLEDPSRWKVTVVDGAFVALCGKCQSRRRAAIGKRLKQEDLQDAQLATPVRSDPARKGT